MSERNLYVTMVESIQRIGQDEPRISDDSTLQELTDEIDAVGSSRGPTSHSMTYHRNLEEITTNDILQMSLNEIMQPLNEVSTLADFEATPIYQAASGVFGSTFHFTENLGRFIKDGLPAGIAFLFEENKVILNKIKSIKPLAYSGDEDFV